MRNMLESILLASAISLGMIIITSFVVYEVLRIIWQLMPRLEWAARKRVLFIIACIFAVHVTNIWLYGAAFFVVENYTNIGVLSGARSHLGVDFDSFLECLYFSSATYTSLGFGDIIPTQNLRMLAAAEVLSGLIMIGWTVAFTFLAMEKFWQLPHGKKR
jgi:hypothetical protein